MTVVDDGLLAKANSPLRRFDPRLALALAVCANLAWAFLPSVTAAGVALALVLSCSLGLRLRWGQVVRRMLPVNALLVAAVLLLPWTIPGEALFADSVLSPSREGFNQAAMWWLRGNAAVLSLLVCLGGCPAHRVIGAAAWWGCPSSLARMALLTLRYLTVLSDQRRRVLAAARLRGWRLRADAQALRHLGWMVGGLIIAADQRAQRVHAAMSLRGFAGRLPKEAWPALSLPAVTLTLASCATVVTVAILPWLIPF